LCEFLALAEITKASGPAETPVICHVAVVVPFWRVPTLKVGTLTVKCPLCEAKDKETLDRAVLSAVFTLFSTTTVTVAV
jgi:hypothetical protein